MNNIRAQYVYKLSFNSLHIFEGVKVLTNTNNFHYGTNSLPENDSLQKCNCFFVHFRVSSIIKVVYIHEYY